MKFEFDTTTDGAKEAAALATALAVLHGESIATALDNALGRMEITGTDTGPLAADGHPVQRPASYGTDNDPRVHAPVTVTATVDTAGLPWDERIHASTKTTNKDGTWSRRRNTPDETFDKVMAELVAARDGAPAEASAADAFAAPAETDTEGQTAETAAPNEPAASGTVVPPPPPTSTPAVSPTTGSVTFPQLMVKITKAQTAGTIDKATIDGFLATFGLDKIAGLASAGADTVQAVNAMVDAHVAG